MNAHADASPSASSIWIPCPASVTLARGKVRKSTPYTREGSAAHAIAEAELKGALHPVLGQTVMIEGEAILVTEEMLQAVAEYVDICVNTAMDTLGSGIEARVQLSHDGEDIFGTCDHYAYDDTTLWVTDFKYGQGVQVSADSSQLKIYALGVLNKLGPFVDIEQIVLTVVQPRAGGTRSHTMTFDELVAWDNQVLYPAMDRLAADDHTEVTGEHCRWCVRAGECKSLAALAMDKAKVAFGAPMPDPTSFSNDELGEILSHAELISAWIVKVRAEVSGRIDNGQQVPGWKLVAKRAVRKIVNEIGALAAILQGNVVPWEEVTRIETLGTVEKVLKKYKLDPSVLDPFIAKESSGSTLVEENNSRPALETDAKKVFS
jgi:hypothetical protein